MLTAKSNLETNNDNAQSSVKKVVSWLETIPDSNGKDNISVVSIG